MKLDHIVYFSAKNPSQIVEEKLKESQHAVVGGIHKLWGTQNALMYTQSAYIEYLSIENMQTAKVSHQPLTRLLIHDLHTGEGWGTMCFSVKGIESFKEKIEGEGFGTTDIMPGQRMTPAGQLLHWKMLFVNKNSFEELPYPFFIEWNETDVQRKARLIGDGSIRPENEQLKIEQLLIATDFPEDESRLWSTLLSVKKSPNNELILSDNIRLTFTQKASGEKARLTEVIFGR